MSLVLDRHGPALQRLRNGGGRDGGEAVAVALARRRRVGGKLVRVREHLLDASARQFLVRYWVPAAKGEPILLPNLRIGGQDRYRWPKGRAARYPP